MILWFTMSNADERSSRMMTEEKEEFLCDGKEVSLSLVACLETRLARAKKVFLVKICI